MPLPMKMVCTWRPQTRQGPPPGRPSARPGSGASGSSPRIRASRSRSTGEAQAPGQVHVERQRWQAGQLQQAGACSAARRAAADQGGGDDGRWSWLGAPAKPVLAHQRQHLPRREAVAVAFFRWVARQRVLPNWDEHHRVEAEAALAARARAISPTTRPTAISGSGLAGCARPPGC